jgi:hypothetical protein
MLTQVSSNYYSLVASTTVDAFSLFGVYVWSGLAIMLIPVFKPELAHLTFQAICYFSILSSVVWMCIQATSLLRVLK